MDPENGAFVSSIVAVKSMTQHSILRNGKQASQSQEISNSLQRLLSLTPPPLLSCYIAIRHFDPGNVACPTEAETRLLAEEDGSHESHLNAARTASLL